MVSPNTVSYGDNRQPAMSVLWSGAAKHRTLSLAMPKVPPHKDRHMSHTGQMGAFSSHRSHENRCHAAYDGRDRAKLLGVP